MAARAPPHSPTPRPRTRHSGADGPAVGEAASSTTAAASADPARIHAAAPVASTSPAVSPAGMAASTRAAAIHCRAAGARLVVPPIPAPIRSCTPRSPPRAGPPLGAASRDRWLLSIPHTSDSAHYDAFQPRNRAVWSLCVRRAPFRLPIALPALGVEAPSHAGGTRFGPAAGRIDAQ